MAPVCTKSPHRFPDKAVSIVDVHLFLERVKLSLMKIPNLTWISLFQAWFFVFGARLNFQSMIKRKTHKKRLVHQKTGSGMA